MLLTDDHDYKSWVSSLKHEVSNAQQRAAIAANSELISLYWFIGHSILAQQEKMGWGAKVIDQLSKDLKLSFPSIKGFSPANLKNMRTFAKNWPDYKNEEIGQQLLSKLPWGHNVELLHKVKSKEERIGYANLIIEHGWSRSMFLHHLDLNTLKRQGKASTNFSKTLPSPQSELAQQTLKSPYVFDFLNVGNEATERDFEDALTSNITRVLLELGKGFSYLGRQYHLEVGGQDFYIDLLLYHTRLHCYIVVELKRGDFKPEYVGKLGFYLTAVDELLRDDEVDKPTIGLLLCKQSNKVIAEYTLKDNKRPIGVAEYELSAPLPPELANKLPSIKDIEQSLTDQLTFDEE